MNMRIYQNMIAQIHQKGKFYDVGRYYITICTSQNLKPQHIVSHIMTTQHIFTYTQTKKWLCIRIFEYLYNILNYLISFYLVLRLCRLSVYRTVEWMVCGSANIHIHKTNVYANIKAQRIWEGSTLNICQKIVLC